MPRFKQYFPVNAPTSIKLVNAREKDIRNVKKCSSKRSFLFLNKMIHTLYFTLENYIKLNNTTIWSHWQHSYSSEKRKSVAKKMWLQADSCEKPIIFWMFSTNLHRYVILKTMIKIVPLAVLYSSVHKNCWFSYYLWLKFISLLQIKKNANFFHQLTLAHCSISIPPENSDVFRGYRNGTLG